MQRAQKLVKGKLFFMNQAAPQRNTAGNYKGAPSKYATKKHEHSTKSDFMSFPPFQTAKS